MPLFSTVVALLAALAIIIIGALYLSRPWAAAPSFGLPLPEAGPNVAWWLRLKGVRDVVSGLIVIAVLLSNEPHLLGEILLTAAIIPIGDMSLVLAARGSKARALSVHGLTAALMAAGALPLLMGQAG